LDRELRDQLRNAAATARMHRLSKMNDGWIVAHMRTLRACGISELREGTMIVSSGV
jgi:hypothetical protein